MKKKEEKKGREEEKEEKDGEIKDAVKEFNRWKGFLRDMSPISYHYRSPNMADQQEHIAVHACAAKQSNEKVKEKSPSMMYLFHNILQLFRRWNHGYFPFYFSLSMFVTYDI